MSKFTDSYKAFIFDLDGTLYRGSVLIPGVPEVISRLRELGKQLMFVSNKTTEPVQHYITFLRDRGVAVEPDEFLTATSTSCAYMAQHHYGKSFYAIGEQPFIQAMTEAGLRFETEPANIDCLLVTLDRTLSYEKLEIAARALEHGARFYAANIDDTCPVESGEIWDAGTTILALEKRTKRKLETYFGKPSALMIDSILSRISAERDEILLCGDRQETDIAMGNQSGIHTALVATGVKNTFNFTSIYQPTYRISSVAELTA